MSHHPKDIIEPAVVILDPAIEEVESADEACTNDNRNGIQKLLGIDPNESKQLKINFNEELKVTWTKWMREGLPVEKKQRILDTYSRKEDFYTEAPKINTDIIPAITDIAKKRVKHFMDTQICVGTAISRVQQYQ